MYRVFVLLLSLAVLPALCLADDVINYQIDVTGDWIETNPSCVTNCTETMNMDYEFESNQDVFDPTSPTNGIYGWIVASTFQISSSGFLGSFAPGLTSALWVDNGPQLSQGIPFFNPQGDEVDLANPGPGLSNTGPATLLIFDCPTSNDCHNAFPNIPPNDIIANSTTSTVVRLPEGSPAWQYLLIAAIACTVGLFVKRRARLGARQPCVPA